MPKMFLTQTVDEQEITQLRENYTEWMVSSLARLHLTKQENMLLFVRGKAIESKPVELETSCTYNDTFHYSKCSLVEPNVKKVVSEQ